MNFDTSQLQIDQIENHPANVMLKITGVPGYTKIIWDERCDHYGWYTRLFNDETGDEIEDYELFDTLREEVDRRYPYPG